jgi:hypothetical protein
MKVDLNTEDLKSLVKGKSINYSEFENKLVVKAGHSYTDCYGRTDWNSLDKLTDEELFELYTICKLSFKK